MPRSPRFAILAALLLGTAAGPRVAVSQAVPARQWEPRGFDFTPDGVWRVRARRVAAARRDAMARGDFLTLNAPLSNRANLVQSGASFQAMAVTGTLRVPVILLRFKDTDPLTTRPASEYASVLFGSTPPAGNPFTVTTFYEQMSNGLFSMQGDVMGWATLDSNMLYYTGSATGCSGLNPYGNSTCNGIWSGSAINAMQAGLREAVQKVDATTDFGQFDNDGPDRMPNSGDDDGTVDMAVFVQPAKDGACLAATNNDLWSHRYVVLGGYQTNDPRPGGGTIVITNYTLQAGVGGATACDATAIMAIGTTAHETGHGLGLPDFYDTNPSDADNSEGIGHWGLMGSGNYRNPPSPAHMEGFSRMQLGWVTVRDLTVAGTYSLGPYTVSDTIFRIVPPGANPQGEYFLIENRQATDGDTALVRSTPPAKGPGLLIWHVDPVKYVGSLFNNQVNSGTIHALWLMQADGLNQLRSSTPGVRNRGDGGDPFPGGSANFTFGVGTNPSVQLNDGTTPLLQIDSIRQVVTNGEMAFRLSFTPALAVVDTMLRPAVMGTLYQDTLRVAGGNGSYSFLVQSGGLPTGMGMTTGGVLIGIPSRDLAFSFVVRATSGTETLDLPLRMVVGAPNLALTNVVNQLVEGGTYLTANELSYIDLVGNHNGSFDIGDFTAWLDKTGVAVSAAVMRRAMRGAR